MNCSSRLSVLLPNCFSLVLTPLGSYWRSNQHTVCLLVQSRQSRPWIQDALTGSSVRKKLSGLFWYDLMSIWWWCCRPPWFQFAFPQQTALWNKSQQREDIDKCQRCTEQRHYSWRFSVCFMWFIENARYKTENTFEENVSVDNSQERNVLYGTVYSARPSSCGPNRAQFVRTTLLSHF